MDDVLGLLHHLALSYPERGLGDRDGKVVYLYAIKLAYRDLYRVAYVQRYLVVVQRGDGLVLQPAQREVRLGQEVAAAAGRVYVLTDFDTIEKAFSGAKAAEKGSK